MTTDPLAVIREGLEDGAGLFDQERTEAENDAQDKRHIAAMAALDLLSELVREAHALVVDTPSPPVWYEDAPDFNGFRLEDAYAAGYDVARFYLRRALLHFETSTEEG